MNIPLEAIRGSGGYKPLAKPFAFVLGVLQRDLEGSRGIVTKQQRQYSQRTVVGILCSQQNG